MKHSGEFPDTATPGGRPFRRRVMYVPGYDPRGYVPYYRMFRTGYEQALKVFGATGDLSRPVAEEHGLVASWTVSTRAPEGSQVETIYDILRWDDLIKKDFDRPLWKKVLRAYTSFGKTVLEGSFFKLYRIDWRFPAFMLSSILVFSTFIAISTGLGWTTAELFALLPIGRALAFIPGFGIFLVSITTLIAITEPHLRLLYQFNAWATTRDIRNRLRPDIEERVDLFASYVVAQASKEDCDELLLVGHSYGSFLAVSALARALKHAPELGLHRPQIALLTLGASLPLVALNRAAEWFRKELVRITEASAIRWFDVQSAGDVISFYGFDALRHLHLPEAGRKAPTIIQVRFGDTIGAERYKKIGWDFYTIHFLYIMHNDKPSKYDYFRIVCGPSPVVQVLSDEQDG